MVTYSFQRRFEGAIREGRKNQTIRAVGKKRHARAGEMIQIYTSMRSNRCQKIRPDVRCVSAQNITLWFDIAGQIERIVVVDQAIVAEEYATFELDAFAKADGFIDIADMSAFWEATHGRLSHTRFDGVLIRWAADDEVKP